MRDMCKEPFRVLTIDGGGMRGLYTVSVLHALAKRFAQDSGSKDLDIGQGFDLVVGTSTGAILATAIAAGVPLDKISNLYEKRGPDIFTDPVPPYGKTLSLRHKARFWCWTSRHLCRAGNSNQELQSALYEIFGSQTFGELYKRRHIGLCVSASAFLTHKPRVFKTPHLEKKDRDNGLLLADACLASSAAPIYLPLASITEDGLPHRAYADGGLWANDPVLLGLIEGLAASKTKQPVLIMSLGTCAPAVGDQPVTKFDRGIIDWGGGISVLELAMNTQGYSARYAVTLLVEQLARFGKHVHVIRCEESTPSSDQSNLLRLDSTSEKALHLMKELGNRDGQEIYRWCQPKPPGIDKRGQLITGTFEQMPEIGSR